MAGILKYDNETFGSIKKSVISCLVQRLLASQKVPHPLPFHLSCPSNKNTSQLTMDETKYIPVSVTTYLLNESEGSRGPDYD